MFRSTLTHTELPTICLYYVDLHLETQWFCVDSVRPLYCINWGLVPLALYVRYNLLYWFVYGTLKDLHKHASTHLLITLNDRHPDWTVWAMRESVII